MDIAPPISITTTSLALTPSAVSPKYPSLIRNNLRRKGAGCEPDILHSLLGSNAAAAGISAELSSLLSSLHPLILILVTTLSQSATVIWAKPVLVLF